MVLINTLGLGGNSKSPHRYCQKYYHDYHGLSSERIIILNSINKYNFTHTVGLSSFHGSGTAMSSASSPK